MILHCYSSVGIPSIQTIPIVESQVEKRIGDEMESRVIRGLYRGSESTNDTYIGP